MTLTCMHVLLRSGWTLERVSAHCPMIRHGIIPSPRVTGSDVCHGNSKASVLLRRSVRRLRVAA